MKKVSPEPNAELDSIVLKLTNRFHPAHQRFVDTVLGRLYNPVEMHQHNLLMQFFHAVRQTDIVSQVDNYQFQLGSGGVVETVVLKDSEFGESYLCVTLVNSDADPHQRYPTDEMNYSYRGKQIDLLLRNDRYCHPRLRSLTREFCVEMCFLHAETHQFDVEIMPQQESIRFMGRNVDGSNQFHIYTRSMDQIALEEVQRRAFLLAQRQPIPLDDLCVH